MTWSDPDTVSNPTTGNAISTTWGDMVNQNLNHNHDRNLPMWVPFADNESGTIGDHTGRVTNGAGQTAQVDFTIADDITSIDAITAVVIATASTGNVTLDFDTDYGADGEAYNAHTGSSVGNTVAVTINQIKRVTVPAGVYPNLAAGDTIGLKITDTGTGRQLRWLGLWVEYTRT